MLQTSKSKFSRSSVSPICKCCGLDYEDLPQMLLECTALINQRKAFYPEFKSIRVYIVGTNQWNKRYTSRKQLAQLILDCWVIPELRESINFLKLQIISSNLCHRLHLARLNKLAH